MASTASSHLSADRVAAVRRFNRFYTRQIGLLDEGLLSSPLSLTQARTLYELAHRKRSTAAELCDALGLDPGYLSRILSSFEKNRLLEKKASPKDARQTLLALTRKGRQVFEPVNARSDEQVRSILNKLSPERQDDLLSSMRTVESLLGPDTGSMNWYFQFTPGDMWDYDEVGTHILIDGQVAHNKAPAAFLRRPRPVWAARSPLQPRRSKPNIPPQNDCHFSGSAYLRRNT